MAFEKPFYGKPSSGKRPSLLNGFLGVHGTAWRKTAAGACQRSETCPVKTDEE